MDGQVIFLVHDFLAVFVNHIENVYGCLIG